MYSNYVSRLSSLGEQMNKKSLEINSVIDELEKKTKSIGAKGLESDFQKIRSLQGELSGMKDDLVSRNDKLEKTVKIQNEKIKRLETCITKLGTEVKGLKVEQVEQGKSFQSQIDELKAHLANSSQAIETGLSTLINKAKQLDGRKGKSVDVE